jgi:hypothetical protein
MMRQSSFAPDWRALLPISDNFPNLTSKIVDAKFEKLKFNQVLDIVRNWQPDLAGFTAFTNEINPAAYHANSRT